MDSGGELRTVLMEDVLPYFIEFPKEKFCAFLMG